MNKTMILTFSLLFSTQIFAGNCDAFQGVWDAEGEASFYPIRITSTSPNRLSIVMNLHRPEHQQFTENYIADGTEHMGDGLFTGNWYTATCSGDRIHITRQFQMALPLLNDYYFAGEELVLEEKFGRTTRISRYTKR